MWFSVTVVYIVLSKCSSLGWQVPDQGGSSAPPNLQDMAYKHLSPEAFFSMKDNLPNPAPPVVPIDPERTMKSGSRPGKPMGPMRPGMGSMNPGSRPGKPMAPDIGLIDAPKPVVMKGYEHFELSTLDAMSRQAKSIENYAEEVTIPNAGDELVIYNLCFALSYIWRRGRESIRKYFHLRDIYHNHLPFEIGYITHVIMSKYQTMLELYEFSASLASAKKNNTVTTLHLTVFQKTIIEDGLTIQHLSNMLHELKNKYSFRSYDPGNKFDIPPPSYYNQTSTTTDKTTTDDGSGRVGKGHPKLDKAYIAKKIEESHKVIDEVMEKRKKKLQDTRDFYKKHGYLPTTTRVPQQPMRLWSPNLDYGWSGEEDW